MVWLTSGALPLRAGTLGKIAGAGAFALLFVSLATNQIFHNGVWGKLHNKSVKPKIEISDASIQSGKLSFTVYRVEGADVYGSFLIGITLKDKNGNVVLNKDAEALSRFPVSNIQNQYIAKVAPGKHSLVIPLGSKADLTISDNSLADLPKGRYELLLTDVSGITWQTDLRY